MNESLESRFELYEKLGSGGFGEVYRAHDHLLGKWVAIKIIPRAKLDNLTIRRLQTEAKIAGKLNHPSLAGIYDFAINSDGSAYMVIELIDGISLAELINEDRPLSPLEFTQIFEPLLSVLSYIHMKDITHRDIKPENVLIVLEKDDDNYSKSISIKEVKLIDFGIARSMSGTDSGKLTRTGAMIGSAPYMSPEQIRGESVDQRADIYSLGCLMFFALTARPPFLKESALETMTAHLSEPIPTLDSSCKIENAEKRQQIEELIYKMLSKHKNDRPASLQEVSEQVKSFFDHYLEENELLHREMEIDSFNKSGKAKKFAEKQKPIIELNSTTQNITTKKLLVVMISAFLICSIITYLYFLFFKSDSLPAFIPGSTSMEDEVPGKKSPVINPERLTSLTRMEDSEEVDNAFFNHAKINSPEEILKEYENTQDLPYIDLSTWVNLKDSDLQSFKNVSKVKQLKLKSTMLKSTTWALRFPALLELELDNVQLEDKDLEPLLKCKKLRYLSLAQNNAVSLEMLKKFARHPSLEVLKISKEAAEPSDAAIQADAETLRDLNKALKVNDRAYIDGMLEKATEHASSKKFDEAFKQYDKVIEILNKDGVGNAKLAAMKNIELEKAKLFDLQNEPTKAISHLKQAVSYAGSIHKSEVDWNNWWTIIQNRQQIKDNKTAAQYMNLYFMLLPDLEYNKYTTVDRLYQNYLTQSKKTNEQEARKILQKALNLAKLNNDVPNIVYSLIHLGQSYFNTSNWQESRKCFAQVVELEYSSGINKETRRTFQWNLALFHAYLALGHFDRELNKGQESLNHLEKAAVYLNNLSSNKENFPFWSQLLQTEIDQTKAFLSAK